MGKTRKELSAIIESARVPGNKAEYAVVLFSSPFVQCGPGLRDQDSGDASPPKGERSDPDWESA
jgi:hypothetical protein